MSEKNFLTISAKDCQTEYKAVIANSDRKLKSAEILAKEQDYGSAVSLLIVSNEELIKALILFLDGQGFELRKVKGIKSLFNNHRLRYLLAMVFSILAIFGEDMKNMLLKVRENPQILHDMMNNKAETGRKLQLYMIEKIGQIQEEIAFFSQVDKMRQTGLYSDKPGNQQITETDYFQFHSKVDKLKKVITYLIEGFQMEETAEQVEKLKKQFKSEGWYDNMAKLISTINSPQVDSYQNLFKEVKEFGKDVAENEDFEKAFEEDVD